VNELEIKLIIKKSGKIVSRLDVVVSPERQSP
jgi:hypothetical protein